MLKINLTIVHKRDYENKWNWMLGENKPNLPNAENPLILRANPPVLQHFVDLLRVFAIFLRTKTADNLTKSILWREKWNMQLAKRAE